MLKSQDVLIALRLAIPSPEWSFRSLAEELAISPAEVHNALKRASICDLIDLERRRAKRRNLTEFLLHGLRYCFPATKGELVRGLPTSYGASPLKESFHVEEDAAIPVWPDPAGTVKGYSFSPLYQSVPEAAKRNSRLYQLLVLTDALRSGRARERNIAGQLLEDFIRGSHEL